MKNTQNTIVQKGVFLADLNDDHVAGWFVAKASYSISCLHTLALRYETFYYAMASMPYLLNDEGLIL